ncbi:cobalt ABC transporter ATP-binding protein [Lactobacillus sp. S2-2]|uniref:energy-coupling factor transporter transmembrane component T family protein n=1 Tax=Lactobacillus sp. S2-2 TaxID=2692917 RepID=UPI001F21F28F|nr:energy-coupling factor transporter transmembrane component T [Lactobacillus sp. S2-2]MCF6514795.1 cobalt ABC transporter ATP-binding protein [Lactobacillus sp. S2-2]
MDKILFGKYVPGKSFIHELNPACKIIISFILILTTLMTHNFIQYAFLLGLLFVLIKISKISIKFFLSGVKPLLWIIILTVMIQLFFSSKGQVIFSFSFIKITDYSLFNSGLIFLRFLIIIIASTLLTLTTNPIEISDGISTILSPLKKVHFPVETVSMMISISLRFVPTLSEETKTILEAQKSRGIDFDTGKLSKRIKNIISLIIPLFVSALRHAEGLANAMEARGYSTEIKRSHYLEYKWNLKETISLIFIILIGIIIWLM